jgi:hypothetical protein
VAVDVQEKIAHFEALRSQRRIWEHIWERIADLTLPRKSGFRESRTPGLRRELQYTGTAIRANELLASSMQGSLTSNIVRWFALSSRAMGRSRQTLGWLEEFSERLYMNLQQSNFHQEMQEVYLDLGAFGNGCIFMDERKGRAPGFAGFRFQAQEIGTYSIAEDSEGHVDTVYRELRISPRAAKKRWGNRVGKRLLDLAERKEAMDEPTDILHGVFPREGATGYGDGTPARRLPFASCYIDLAGTHLIEELGFHEMPVMVPRWTKVSGETYGRGPGFTALGDISSLNEAMKLNLQSWAKALSPPLMRRHDGVIGNPKITPNSFIDVYDMEALKPLEFGTRFDINVIEREALQADIRNTFFWEQLQLPNQQLYTATEVERRLELMQRILGPTLGRLEIELHQPLIMRGASMMLRAGLRAQFQDPAAAPEPPSEVADMLARGVADVEIEYLGPLARAQKSADAQSLAQTLQIAAPIIQLDPDARDVYDLDEWLRYVAERRGLPSRLVRDRGRVGEIREAKTQERQQAAQQEQMMGMAEMAGKAAPAIKAAQSLPPHLMGQEQAEPPETLPEESI